MKTETQIVEENPNGLNILFGKVNGWIKLVMFIIFLTLTILLITR